MTQSSLQRLRETIEALNRDIDAPPSEWLARHDEPSLGMAIAKSLGEDPLTSPVMKAASAMQARIRALEDAMVPHRDLVDTMERAAERAAKAATDPVRVSLEDAARRAEAAIGALDRRQSDIEAALEQVAKRAADVERREQALAKREDAVVKSEEWLAKLRDDLISAATIAGRAEARVLLRKAKIGTD